MEMPVRRGPSDHLLRHRPGPRGHTPRLPNQGLGSARTRACWPNAAASTSPGSSSSAIHDKAPGAPTERRGGAG